MDFLTLCDQIKIHKQNALDLPIHLRSAMALDTLLFHSTSLLCTLSSCLGFSHVLRQGALQSSYIIQETNTIFYQVWFSYFSYWSVVFKLPDMENRSSKRNLLIIALSDTTIAPKNFLFWREHTHSNFSAPLHQVLSMLIKPQLRICSTAKEEKVTGVCERYCIGEPETRPLFDIIYSNPQFLQIKHE